MAAIFARDLTISGKLDMGSKQIKNLAAPTNSLDAISRTYMENNSAKISSSDNRLILKRYGAYTTEYDALSVIDKLASGSYRPHGFV